MNDQQFKFWKVIEILDKLNFLKYVLIIGSWAEYLYEVSGYLSNFKSNIKTRDMDILIKNIRKPSWKVDILNKFEEENFDVVFTNGGLTKLVSEVLEVEFIVQLKGKGQMEPFNLKHLGVVAEGLRYMEYPILYSTQLEVNSYIINVPTPAIYIIHKLIINSKRREEKREKDIRSINFLLDNVRNNESEYNLLMLIYNDLPPKTLKKVNIALEENNIIL